MPSATRQAIYDRFKKAHDKLSAHFAEGGILSKDEKLVKKFEDLKKEVSSHVNEHGEVRSNCTYERLRLTEQKVNRLVDQCNKSLCALKSKNKA